MVERQMIANRRLVGMTVAAFTGLVITGDFSCAAINASGVDPSDQLNGAPSSLAIGTELGASGNVGTEPGAAGKDSPTSANPLWAIPLGSLTATRDRPVFSPSRRVPAPAVAAAPVEPAKPVYVPPPEPEKPQLSLVGVVTGISGGFAVFLNTATHDILRLKLGEGNEGWVLRSVKGREAVLEKNHQTAVIGLPASEDNPK
jgi:general secretion pathway protein N